VTDHGERRGLEQFQLDPQIEASPDNPAQTILDADRADPPGRPKLS